MSEIIDGKKRVAAHAEQHESGGFDEMDLSGLSGGGGLFAEDASENIFGGTDAGATLAAGALGNFIAGVRAANLLATGDYNTIIGHEAGRVNVASNNTFIGMQAGEENTSGYKSVAIGQEAGQENQTGFENVLVGYRAGYGTLNNSFSRNTYVGFQVNLAVTDGSNNVAMGRHALYYNETGDFNVIIGAEAGFGVTGNSYSNNVFIGYQAGLAMTTGVGNVFLGYQAGAQETGSNKLYIANTNTTTPLIGGDFSAVTLGFLGKTPVAQQAFQSISASPTQGEVEAVRDVLIAFGFMAAS